MEEKAKLKLRVKFYATEAGHEPVLEWLRSLDKDLKKIVGEDIRAAQMAWPPGMPLAKYLGDKIWEIRSTTPHGIIRVFCAVKGGGLGSVTRFCEKNTEAAPARS